MFCFFFFIPWKCFSLSEIGMRVKLSESNMRNKETCESTMRKRISETLPIMYSCLKCALLCQETKICAFTIHKHSLLFFKHDLWFKIVLLIKYRLCVMYIKRSQYNGGIRSISKEPATPVSVDK